MDIAFLFNSDHPRLGGYYGLPIMEAILATGVLQSDERNMRVSIGDILTYMNAPRMSVRTKADLVTLCRSVYSPASLDLLHYERLEATYTEATVYCWLFQNMTSSTAIELHNCLSKSEESYLGAMDVKFSNPIHLNFFRNSLIELYRLNSPNCSIFYMMSENECPDITIEECFKSNGYLVKHEDIGARRTFFDDYDTLEHFQRIGDFKAYISNLKAIGPELADDIIHSLEELHPQLFDSFAAAVRTLARAETEEDLAQSSLSGRRVLEKIADYLYPPRSGLFNGRKVGKAEYKNRLWAYIETTIEEFKPQNGETLESLGLETDRLVSLFNSGLHSNPTRAEIECAFQSLMLWLTRLINLSPAKARKPYLAYEAAIVQLFTEQV